MKVALYTRVSTEDQVKEGTSLEVQREFLVNYAKNNNHEVFKVYVDDGYSGSNLKRPELKKLLKDGEKKKFNAVLVYKIDRFARNNRLLLNLVEELDNKGIGFKSATESFDTVTASGKMALSMLGTVAQFERDRIAERVFPGMIKGVKRGNWQGARYAPYGYRYNKKEKLLKVDEEEAKIVRLIYKMYSDGISTLRIAGYLNKNGHRNRIGRKFHTKLIGDILKNQVYLGKIIWNRRHYDTKQKTKKGYKYVKNEPSKIIVANGRHSPIVSQDEFDRVQEILKERRKGIVTRANSRDYLLTGLVICAKCSHKYQGCAAVASRRNRKAVKKRRYYRCGGSTAYDTKCGNSLVRADDIETEIFRIVEVIANTPFVEEFLTETIEKDMITNDAELEKEFNKFNKMLKDNLSQQKRLSINNLQGLMADEVYREQCLELRDEERQIRTKISSIRQRIFEKKNSLNYKKLVMELIEQFDNVKKSLDVIGKKMLLRVVFKNIIVLDGKIKSFELYEPFKQLYEEGRKLWQEANVSTCELSDVR